MLCFFVFAGVTLEDKAADHRNIAELSPGHFSAVDAALNIGAKIIAGEQFIYIRVVDGHGLITEQFKPVIIHGEGKTNGSGEAYPIRQKSRHCFMHQSSFEWIYKKMIAVPRLNLFDQ